MSLDTNSDYYVVLAFKTDGIWTYSESMSVHTPTSYNKLFDGELHQVYDDKVLEFESTYEGTHKFTWDDTEKKYSREFTLGQGLGKLLLTESFNTGTYTHVCALFDIPYGDVPYPDMYHWNILGFAVQKKSDGLPYDGYGGDYLAEPFPDSYETKFIAHAAYQLFDNDWDRENLNTCGSFEFKNTGTIKTCIAKIDISEIPNTDIYLAFVSDDNTVNIKGVWFEK